MLLLGQARLDVAGHVVRHMGGEVVGHGGVVGEGVVVLLGVDVRLAGVVEGQVAGRGSDEGHGGQG